MSRDWVLSQVQPYELRADTPMMLPRILYVHPSRAAVFALLKSETSRCFGGYDEKRLVSRSTTGGVCYEYEPPEGAPGGAFAVVQAGA